jgi:hypothetical protein
MQSDLGYTLFIPPKALAENFLVHLQGRLKPMEPVRSRLVLAQLIDSVGVERRTGIDGWLDDGPRGAMLRRWKTVHQPFEWQEFRAAVQNFALVEMVRLDDFEAWKEVAFAASAPMIRGWKAILLWARDQGVCPLKGVALAEGYSESKQIFNYAEGYAMSLEIKEPGSARAVVARERAERAREAIAFAQNYLAAWNE